MSDDDRVIVMVDEDRRSEIQDGLLRASITAEFAAGWAERRTRGDGPVTTEPPAVRVPMPEVRLSSLRDFLGIR